ncbi:RND family efflux transporter MFP subunit [Methylobacterium sp. GXF4]|jgi:Cu(I)/Ag(I) efflux system membrane fusion protein|uniref:Cu(I)/Ag(I) efflux system membrane fusion protein n=1 Tax=Methylobacterium brachiatum TaxID=269660 RepID=A0AAJ1WWZ2_9HYPH|nr:MULTISPECIES: efflux RND transporter periplasmic adaptor subunit [Methylobacterium]EIZ87191.1 RND family efflux transporter MFP subunit [Methylobacterium sp. GXF4]MCB4801522.1 efflux RND transporter periplasmic adaptor subunit [Methylobacterium brachiatum]MCJ2086155.1 efflux RND transporter periplasmic adaptor subunit [Methylobacterium sp. E-005]MDQ0544270.1 Cu(I)/Ag(I) efflux system membrane fusion protein [Methylobacterium brachiatum]
MSRSAWFAGSLAALAAWGTGLWVGRDGPSVSDLAARAASRLPVAFVDRARDGFARWMPSAAGPPAARLAAASGPVVYYRDPDGKPAYSLAPMATGDGREFRAVHASEDVRFDGEDAEAGAMPAEVTGKDMTGHDMGQGGMAAGAAGPGNRRVLYYRNPMGLPDTSPVPKKDSMGMNYIPVYAGEDEGGGVKISPGKVQRTGVRTEVAERRVLSLPVRAPGSVEEDERRISVIAMRTDAYIEKVEPVTTGDHVHKGQPLLRLFAPEINAVAAQYLTSIGYEGGRRRLENLAIPPEVIDEIERTHKVPPSIVWSSPRDGVVVERNVSDGMKAKSGDVLFRIVDHTRVWVLADVPERDLAAVAEGQKATVRVRAFPERTFSGTVTRIYPHLMAETRTARLRIELPNPDGALRPSMYADVEIATGDAKPVVAVPDDAVIDTGERQVVLLDHGEGRFEPKPVKIGLRGRGYTEIREGVSAGDRVVTAANFLIDAESNLKAALQSLTAPKDDRQAAGTGATP